MKYLSLAALLAMAASAAAQDYDALVTEIAAEVRTYCGGGSALTLAPGSITTRTDGSTGVDISGVDRDFGSAVHPFCGARYCQVWTDRWTGSGWQRIAVLLE